MPQLTDLTVDWVSLVDRAAVRDPQAKSEPRRFLLWKRQDGVNPNKGDGHMADLSADQMQAAIDKAEQEKNDAVKKAEEERDAAVAKAEELEKAVSKSPGEGEDKDDNTEDKKPALNKADLTPEVRALVEKAEQEATETKTQLAKAQADAAEAGEIAKAERDQRVGREFVAKAEGFKALPINPSDFGPVLKSVSEKLTKEESEALDEVLKAADEQIAQSDLFKEMGRSGGSDGTGDDAFSKAQRKAEEIRKADTSLSPEQALQKAMADPEIAREYSAEQRG